MLIIIYICNDFKLFIDNKCEIISEIIILILSINIYLRIINK
uniref:Uncharacterized protein n=1 Tax=Macrococcoides canis TaxID=1855823 RepID=A0A4Y5F779_9STAP|nr:hypothetical protein [Macrococcus canis]